MFFWNSLIFSVIQRMLAIWSLVPLPFLKPAWTSGSSWFKYCWSLAWRILSINLLGCAAAAKSLQSCPGLCDPIDGSPPGFPVPGILQARILEWVAIYIAGETIPFTHWFTSFTWLKKKIFEIYGFMLQAWMKSTEHFKSSPQVTERNQSRFSCAQLKEV